LFYNTKTVSHSHSTTKCKKLHSVECSLLSDFRARNSKRTKTRKTGWQKSQDDCPRRASRWSSNDGRAERKGGRRERAEGEGWFSCEIC